jgi:hypothetical protein
VDTNDLSKAPNLGQAFSLLGLNFSLPVAPQTVIEEGSLTVTVPLSAGEALRISSGLAWLRDLGGTDFREVQNDEEERLQDVVSLELRPKEAIDELTLLKLDDDLTSVQLLPPHLNPAVQLHLTLGLNVGGGFDFPFLKRKGVPSIPDILGQSITIGKHGTNGDKSLSFEFDVTLGDEIKINVPITLKIGSLSFAAVIPVTFDPANFALEIDHDQGVDLLASEPDFTTPELLGLTWTFRGASYEDRFHYLTLVTKDLNYQLQLAPGASLELAYTEISREPIVFRVTEFVLSPQGLTLTAGITDTPVRLNGLDTKFRFAGSQLRIVENKIQDLTIAGSGPLPPDLVGDAVADIALQFQQVEGGLRLVSGGAQLRGDKPLVCKGTRFQFSIDAIALKFVYDQKFHLYFALTGQAKFVPEPSDDKDGPLALLPEITLDLVECPLTGDASIIAKHISFLVEFPTPLSFSFLGAYGFELRAIGFLPQCEKFDGRAAMILSGQVMFAQGSGDLADPKPDLHKLYIGLPPKGQTKPQVDMGTLPVGIKAGETFKLSGSVGFKFDATMQGFTGDGVLEITGLPPMAASFGFMRVRRDADAPWVRAWFIYIEVRQVSFRVPILEFYIREVGLGFGYRFTLVSIKAADEAGDIKQLIRELKALSRTQGDLSKQDRWAVDLEEAGQDPRWTIVLRAMISQLSAAPSPLTWNELNERKLSNTYLFDAIIAVRSDLTFFMAVRGWLNTNYATFVQARNDDKPLAPLVSGFVLLSVRQKRFLAHLASNPDGHLGTSEYPLKPPLPEFMVRALRNVQFSATLLIEPGLMHFELGWPNMLRWKDSLGPLTAELRGGFIFRISTTELLIGVSYLARARLAISASINLGLVGASLTAVADAAYGARFIALIPFDERSLAVYGAIGLELRIQIALSLWIKIPLIFYTIKLSFSFRFQIGFTAGLEVGVHGRDVGLRGRGTVSLSVMGHSLQFSVRLGVNEGAVTAARLATEKYLHIGLEATDVETVLPGVDARAVAAPERAFALPAAEALSESAEPGFSAPDYSVFVIRGSEPQDDSYFVLLPKGEKPDGTPEPGFLPVPPNQGIEVETDFQLELPSKIEGLQWFAPNGNGTPSGWVDIEGTAISWRANWGAPIKQIDDSYSHETMKDDDSEESAQPDESGPTGHLKLQEYLRQAFLVKNGNAEAEPKLDAVVPKRDPDPIYDLIERLEDERVQNPSDGAFEAAVRGAVEQFRGSPFFKHDPNLAYDRILEEAFDPDTTVYTDDGSVPQDDAGRQAMEANQQAHQIRGLVIHDLVNDLRDYVAASTEQDHNKKQQDLAASSIPFQMGLVFRVPADKVPDWLTKDVAAPEDLPTIRQRVRPEDTEPTPEAHTLQTFNVRQTDFATHPPQFQRVQHFTDANTIAIAWDLEWEQTDGLEDVRAEPEHHLQYYRVRRRPLDGRTPEVVYQVKNASVLRKQQGGLLSSLKPRFQVVDHFNEETLEEQAGLPATGRSYLYTITPVDFCDKLGQPLTLVATRYPNEPPRVPVDGELTIEYLLQAQDLSQLDVSAADHPAPRAIEPHGIQVNWSEPSNPKEGPTVAIDDYYLIFRREATLPIGSYGLDSSTQRARTGLLPTSNARALPTDVKVLLVPQGPRGGRFATCARLPSDGQDVEEELLEVLRRAGVFPAEPDNAWRPEAWRVFLQTVSINQVPSALAPVQLLLRARSDDPAGVEERHPAELEWLPRPVVLPMLPPEDQRGVPGIAHLPMPVDGDFAFTGTLGNVAYQTHPLGLRCIRFRWNQGPSGLPDYPLDLTAGYDLLELDVDAHTSDTFSDPERLEKALRRIQEVQMLPADDLLLAPGDTLSTNQWEAWYPSAILRRRPPDPPLEGSELEEGPWHSWRESILEWPEWPGLTDLTDGQVRAPRPEALHPFLGQIIAALQEDYIVDLQTSPPFQPQDFDGFLQGTDPESDPYGWGVLQRFGLAVAFSLHQTTNGELVAGQDLLNAVGAVLDGLQTTHGAYYQHLHVELLFQPGRRVELEETSASADALLGITQLSLRPSIQQVLQYGRVEVQGPAGQQAHLAFTYSQPFSLINPSDPASGQVELEPVGEKETVKRTITLPANGVTNLLLRGAELPCVRLDPEKATENEGVEIGSQGFAASEPFSAYFSRSVDSLAEAFASGEKGWTCFKRYAEALTPLGSGEPYTEVKTDEAGLKEQLPAFLAWAQRFFDASAPVEVEGDGLAHTGTGPWLATAYPRVATPALVAPDASGRLTYDHLLQDKWAHDYRYYVRPYDRYWLLWHSLAKSPALFAQDAVQELGRARPDPAAGGLDVVLDRTQPVDMPLVLNSARLDPPSTPGQPAAPGSTWEVIVARHPEQALIERNQTLARQLAFRQVAFTLLRRFAHDGWVDTLEAAVVIQGGADEHQIALKWVEDELPDGLPESYPEQPEHINLDGSLSDAVARSLDLPQRIGTFQQGALVLQWEALPFFYEHRLLLMAQTASTVSPVNQVTQRDFEYRSPDLFDESRDPLWTASVDGQREEAFKPGALKRLQRFVEPELEATVDLYSRAVQIPLHRFWDCLPQQAQKQWAAEKPSPEDGNQRKPGSLPDPEVVYQIVEIREGDIEVQAEFYFDHNEGVYAVRQPGKRFFAELTKLAPPSLDAPQADYVLHATLRQVSEVTLQREIDESAIPEPTRLKIDLASGKLYVLGVLSRQDYLDIVLQPVEEYDLLAGHLGADLVQQEQFLAEWYAVRRVTLEAPELPAALAGKVEYRFIVTWTGPMTQDQNETLIALIGEMAADRLEAALSAATFQEPYVVWEEPQIPDISGLEGKFDIDTAVEHEWTLSWTGPLSEGDVEALLGLEDDQNLRMGIRSLIEKVLSGQTWDVERLKQAAADAQADADAAKANEEPNADELQAEADAAKVQADAAEAVLNAAKAKYAQLTPTEPSGPITPAELTNPLEGTTFTVRVPWRVTAGHIQQFLGPEQASRVTLPPPEEQMRWENIYDLDTGSTVEAVRTGLNGQYPAIQPFPVVQAFIQAFAKLVDQIGKAAFTIDCRPTQSDFPQDLPAQLSVREKLIHAKGPLSAEERATLLAAFPDEPDPDRVAVQRLIDDLLDKETLDRLYNGWFVQESVSEVVSLNPLPEDLQELVDFQGDEESGWYIRYHGIMTPEQGRALQALFTSPKDQCAIESLYARSVSRGLHGSELKIVARRGGAAPNRWGAPSEMRSLEATPLG